MTTDRLTVSVPSELGESLRRIAASRRESVSSVVAKAIADEVRQVALAEFLTHAKKDVGPLPQALLDDADRVLDRAAAKVARPRKARRAPSRAA
jgi:hypothetical protein